MADNYDPKFGNVVAIGPLGAANLTTQAANQDLTLANGGSLVSMPQSGSVVGISISGGSQTITAGSITAKAHKASTEMANSPAPALDATNTNGSYASTRPGAVRFAAGDKLGVSVSTTTDMTPTNTPDVDTILYVVFDPQ